MAGKYPILARRRAAVLTAVAIAAALGASLTMVACSDGRGSSIKGAPPFRHMVIDRNPATGVDCCTDICALGDIDGDGYLDVVIGAEKALEPGLVWYQFPTWRRHAIASGQFTTDGQTADMDKDGDLDVVVTDYGEGIFWYENPSDLSATQWRAHLIGEGYGHDLEVGDVDGDGNLDVVTCDKERVVLWTRAGGDRWSPSVVHDRPGEGTALVDIDGDGDLDIAFHGLWLENSGTREPSGVWRAHTVASGWHNEARVATADMNGDGRGDVVLSVSESSGPIAWFECPADPSAEAWVRHDIDAQRLTGVHGLQVADFDGDGDLDVATSEMHSSPKRRVTVYLNDDGVWRGLELSRDGSHNIRAGDIGSDGDVDVVGKNYGGAGRVVEMWENMSAPGQWDYFSADERRPDSEKWKMGLVFADVNRDGFDDIVGGSCVYLNPGPGGMIKGPWERIRLDAGVDVFFSVDVDGDDLCDLVGMSGTGIVWLEADSPMATGWTAVRVAGVPEDRTQGYTLAQIRAGGRPELVFTRGKALYYVVIPDKDPGGVDWKVVEVSRYSEEEGVAAGDVDGDGDADLAGVASDGHHAVWFENPGDGRGGWTAHAIGTSAQWMDRVALADVDGDSRLDVVVSEENQDWDYNARIYWFRAPDDPANGVWVRNTIALLRSVNSMDVADMDDDGDVDVVAAEHTDQKRQEAAPDNLTAWFENPGGEGRWVAHPIDISNRSSHLGTRLRDLDGDGDLDAVSIAWRQYRYLHVWLNYIDE